MRRAAAAIIVLGLLAAGCSKEAAEEGSALPAATTTVPATTQATVTTVALTTTVAAATTTTEAPDREFSGSLEATDAVSGTMSFVVSGSGQIMLLKLEPVLDDYDCGMVEHPEYTTWQSTVDFSGMASPIMVENGQFSFDGGASLAFEGTLDSATSAHGTVLFEVPGCSPMYAASAAWTATASASGSEASATTTTAAAGTTVTELAIGVEVSGSGNDVLAIPLPDRETVIISFTTDGSAGFRVESPSFFGIMSVGAYQGTRLTNAWGDTDLVMLQITTDGNWTVLVEPLASAPRIPESGTYEGVGDAVLIDTFAPASDFQATFTYAGEGNFAVDGWGANDTLTQTAVPFSALVNIIASYEGTVTVPGDTVVYDIWACSTTCDPWTVTLDR
jgi:hypothetical protein